jgi:polar amino acid transport system substrate-binding protein
MGQILILINIEALRAIFEPQGISVEYQTMPWNRSLDEVRKGGADVVIAADRSDIPEAIAGQEPCGFNRQTVFVKAGMSWKYTDPSSLKQIKLGVIDGYTNSSLVTKHINENKSAIFSVTGDDPLPKMFKMIAAGRIDGFIEDPNVGQWSLKSAGLSGKIIAAADVSGSDVAPLVLLFSPSKPTSRDYAAKYDEGMRALRKSGKLKEILAKYGLKDWK